MSHPQLGTSWRRLAYTDKKLLARWSAPHLNPDEEVWVHVKREVAKCEMENKINGNV
jgi:hypothetical protein